LSVDEQTLEEIYNKMVHGSSNLATINEDGIINFQSFLTHTQDSPFVRKVFKTTGHQDSQIFDLDMFISGLSKFCTMDDTDIGLYIFGLYLEEEQDKELSVERISEMFSDVHGEKASRAIK
jgi:hypothetical protein